MKKNHYFISLLNYCEAGNDKFESGNENPWAESSTLHSLVSGTHGSGRINTNGKEIISEKILGEMTESTEKLSVGYL